MDENRYNRGNTHHPPSGRGSHPKGRGSYRGERGGYRHAPRQNNTGRHLYGRGQGYDQQGGDGRRSDGRYPDQGRGDYPTQWGDQPRQWTAQPNRWEAHPHEHQYYPNNYYPQPVYYPNQYWDARCADGNEYEGVASGGGGAYQHGGEPAGRWDHFKEEKDRAEMEEKNKVEAQEAKEQKEEGTKEIPKMEVQEEGVVVAGKEEDIDKEKVEVGGEWVQPRKTTSTKTSTPPTFETANKNPYAPLEEIAQEQKKDESQGAGKPRGKTGEKSRVITPAKPDDVKQPEEGKSTFITIIAKGEKTKAMEAVERKLRAKVKGQITKEDFKDLEIQEALSLMISLASFEALKQTNRPRGLDLKTIAATAQFMKVESLIKVLQEDLTARELVEKAKLYQPMEVKEELVYPAMVNEMYDVDLQQLMATKDPSKAAMRRVISQFGERMYGMTAKSMNKYVKEIKRRETLADHIKRPGSLTKLIKEGKEPLPFTPPFYFVSTQRLETKRREGSKYQVVMKSLPDSFDATRATTAYPPPGMKSNETIEKMILRATYKCGEVDLPSPFEKIEQTGEKGEIRVVLHGRNRGAMKEAIAEWEKYLNAQIKAKEGRLKFEWPNGQDVLKRQMKNKDVLVEIGLKRAELETMGEEESRSKIYEKLASYLGGKLAGQALMKARVRLNELTNKELLDMTDPTKNGGFMSNIGNLYKSFKYGKGKHGSNVEHEMLIKVIDSEDGPLAQSIPTIITQFCTQSHSMLQDYGHVFQLVRYDENNNRIVSKDGVLPTEGLEEFVLSETRIEGGVKGIDLVVATSYAGFGSPRRSSENTLHGNEFGQWVNQMTDLGVKIIQVSRSEVGRTTAMVLFGSYIYDDDCRGKTELGDQTLLGTGEQLDPNMWGVGTVTLRIRGTRFTTKCVLAKPETHASIQAAIDKRSKVIPPNHVVTREWIPVPYIPNSRPNQELLLQMIDNTTRRSPKKTYVEIMGITEEEMFMGVPQDSLLPGEEFEGNTRTTAQLILDGHRNVGGRHINSVVTKVTPTELQNRFRIFAKREDAMTLVEQMEFMTASIIPQYVPRRMGKLRKVGIDKSVAMQTQEELEVEAAEMVEREHVDEFGRRAQGTASSSSTAQESIVMPPPPPRMPTPLTMPPPPNSSQMQRPASPPPFPHTNPAKSPSQLTETKVIPPNPCPVNTPMSGTTAGAIEGSRTGVRREGGSDESSREEASDWDNWSVGQIQADYRRIVHENLNTISERDRLARLLEHVTETGKDLAWHKDEVIHQLNCKLDETNVASTPSGVTVDLTEIQSSISSASESWRKEYSTMKTDHDSQMQQLNRRHMMDMKEMQMRHEQRESDLITHQKHTTEALHQMLAVYAKDGSEQLAVSYRLYMLTTGVSQQMEHMISNLKFGDEITSKLEAENSEFATECARVLKEINEEDQLLGERVEEFASLQKNEVSFVMDSWVQARKFDDEEVTQRARAAMRVALASKNQSGGMPSPIRSPAQQPTKSNESQPKAAIPAPMHNQDPPGMTPSTFDNAQQESTLKASDSPVRPRKLKLDGGSSSGAQATGESKETPLVDLTTLEDGEETNLKSPPEEGASSSSIPEIKDESREVKVAIQLSPAQNKEAPTVAGATEGKVQDLGSAEAPTTPIVFAEDSEGGSGMDTDEVCVECGLQGELHKCEGSTGRSCNNYIHKECLATESPKQCRYCKSRDGIQDPSADGEHGDDHSEDESSESEHSSESAYSGIEGMRKPKAKANPTTSRKNEPGQLIAHQGFAIGTGQNSNHDGKSRRIISVRKQQQVLTPDPKRAMTRSRREE